MVTEHEKLRKLLPIVLQGKVQARTKVSAVNQVQSETLGASSQASRTPQRVGVYPHHP